MSVNTIEQIDRLGIPNDIELPKDAASVKPPAPKSEESGERNREVIEKMITALKAIDDGDIVFVSIRPGFYNAHRVKGVRYRDGQWYWALQKEGLAFIDRNDKLVIYEFKEEV